MKEVVVAAVLVVLSSSAWGKDNRNARVWTVGTDLVEGCNTMEQFAAGACAGFVTAVAEIVDSGYMRGYRSCIPQLASKGKLIETVKKYMAKHPELGEYTAYQVVVMALVEAFPCKSR